jgi:hypothetical protein
MRGLLAVWKARRLELHLRGALWRRLSDRHTEVDRILSRHANAVEL